MAIPGYTTLVYYSTPPNSYIGASIFLSYIVLALYATLSILASLYTQYTSIFTSPATNQTAHARIARKRQMKIYAFLASISFATLSYHMLFFLITHYFDWQGVKHRNIAAVSGEGLKRWMLESTLFQDFAGDLVKNAQNAMWTQAAILCTWFWNLWIAGKAREYNFDNNTMAKYVLLSQILPISFTASLFIIQLHLAAQDIHPPLSSNRPSITSADSVTPLIPNVVLNGLLLAQPFLRHKPVFSTILFLERGILLLPHTGLLSLKRRDLRICVAITVVFVATSLWVARRELDLGNVLRVLGGGLGEEEGGFAVKALGWDGVLGATVCGVLAGSGGV